MTKNQRQRMIADWLRQHRIGSQEELVARLDLAGMSATQATVSRDLDELGAVRIRRDGAMHYRLPEQLESGDANRLDQRLVVIGTEVLLDFRGRGRDSHFLHSLELP